MKEIEVNTKMIAACGLYCGACKKYRMGKCQGCNTSDTDNPGLGQPLNKWPQRCKIRKCCMEKGFHTCAECERLRVGERSSGMMDVKECRLYNNFVSKVFAFVFRSDRPACIRYIRENGEQAFAEEMTKRGEQTIRK